MSYKSNYEPYTSQDFPLDARTSEEVINSLGALYPHVVALQLQSKAGNYLSHQDFGYWIDSYSTESSSDYYSMPSTRRNSSDSSLSARCRLVSRIRRFLNRDEIRRRQRA